MIESFGASGEISGLDFPKLLIFLLDTIFTGKATLNVKEYSKTVFVNNGKLSYAVSNDPNDTFDTILEKYGIIESSKVKSAVEKAKQQNKSLAMYLIESSIATPEDLVKAAGFQIKDVVKSLITENAITYFLKKEVFPPNAPDHQINPYQLSYECILELDDMDWIHKQLGSIQRIFAHSDDFVERYRKIQYSETTDLIVAKIDGKNSIEKIISSSGIESNITKRTIAALYSMNMVKIISDSPLSGIHLGSREEAQVTQRMGHDEMAQKIGLEQGTEIPKPPVVTEQKTTSDSGSIEQEVKPSAGDQVLQKITSEKDVKEALKDIKKLTGSHPAPAPQGIPPLTQPRPYISDSTRTDQYMEILQRQRKKKRTITITTLILFLLLAILTILYFVFFQQDPAFTDLLPANNASKTITDKTDTNHQVTPKPTTVIPVAGETGQKPANTPPVRNEDPVRILQRARNKAAGLMNNKKYRQAAQTWSSEIANFNGYTISIEIACSDDSITMAYQYDKKLDSLFILPKDLKGRSCYRVCWGLYGTEASAQKGFSTLPRYYQNQDPKPKPISYISAK